MKYQDVTNPQDLIVCKLLELTPNQMYSDVAKAICLACGMPHCPLNQNEGDK